MLHRKNGRKDICDKRDLAIAGAHDELGKNSLHQLSSHKQNTRIDCKSRPMHAASFPWLGSGYGVVLPCLDFFLPTMTILWALLR